MIKYEAKKKKGFVFLSVCTFQVKVLFGHFNHNTQDSSGDSQLLNIIIMESTNLYHHHHHHQLQQQLQQQQQQLVYPSLSSSPSSAARVSTSNERNLSMVLGGDDFNRYMNYILPNSREYFWPPTINLSTEDTKSCDLRSINSDCFLKSNDMNGSILKNSYIKNGQHDASIDLNENLWIGSFSHGHTNQKLSTNESYSNGENFVRFAGLAPSPPNYIASCTSESKDQHNFYVFNSTLPSLPLATEMDCRNYDDGCTHESFEERTSSGYCQVQQSSDSPSNSCNKTPTFRKQVSRLKTRTSTPSHEVAKRPRLVPHSSCPTLKVRKEKLGDRIAALHRLVSPFGKTDTASVLTEANGYIQFLQDQIQTLSMSYLQSSRSKSCRTIRGELLSMKEHTNQEQRATQDLKSRGLCLVPLALTSYVCCCYNGSV